MKKLFSIPCLSEVKYGCKIEKVVYFGEGAWDYSISKKLGLNFIGLDFNQENKLKKLGAEHVFEDFRNFELIDSTLRGI